MEDELFLPKCPNGLVKIKPLAVKPRCQPSRGGGVSTNSNGEALAPQIQKALGRWSSSAMAGKRRKTLDHKPG
jgi:hypothetical protein